MRALHTILLTAIGLALSPSTVNAEMLSTQEHCSFVEGYTRIIVRKKQEGWSAQRIASLYMRPDTEDNNYVPLFNHILREFFLEPSAESYTEKADQENKFANRIYLWCVESNEKYGKKQPK